MPRDIGTPLRRPSQIADEDAVRRAVDLLLYGGDEPIRDTRSRGWNKPPIEGESAMKMWYEELADIDALISENVEVNPSVLPTGSLLSQIDEVVERLSTCYALAVPVYQKRALHIHYDALAEVAGSLRGGKINAAEAQARFSNIMAEVNEIVDFSNLFQE